MAWLMNWVIHLWTHEPDHSWMSLGWSFGWLCLLLLHHFTFHKLNAMRWREGTDHIAALKRISCREMVQKSRRVMHVLLPCLKSMNLNTHTVTRLWQCDLPRVGCGVVCLYYLHLFNESWSRAWNWNSMMVWLHSSNTTRNMQSIQRRQSIVLDKTWLHVTNW